MKKRICLIFLLCFLTFIVLGTAYAVDPIDGGVTRDITSPLITSSETPIYTYDGAAGKPQYFRFIPADTKNYYIKTVSDIDTIACIYSHDGSLLVDSADGGGGVNNNEADDGDFGVSYNFTAGEMYYISINNYNPDKSVATLSITGGGLCDIPGAPTGITVAAGDGEAVVSFEVPASDGGSAITSYTVISNPDGITVTGTGSAITIKGLSNGTAYTFKVKAANAVGTGAESAESTPVTPVGKPGLPTGVTAAAGDGEAAVSFGAPASDGGSTITSYTVTSNPDGIIATGTGSAITVKGLTNGRAYTFKVKASNAIGTGAESAASLPVTPAGKPGAPTGVTAAAGDGEAVISFGAPASDGGSAITSYTVTSSPDGITATGTGSAITVKGLTNGRAYTFKIKAINAIGTGAESAASLPVTPAGKPGAPTGVTAAAGDGEAVISFGAPASDGGSAITSYTVTSSPGGITATGTGSAITVKGLSNGTAYTFKVKAINAIGTGAESAESTPVTPVGKPEAPTGVTAAAGDGEAVVSFVAPASDGGSVITLYTVTSSPDGITATGTGSAITVKGLSNGTAYTFKVKAINAIGTGAESAASAPVTPAGKPGLPTGVTAAAGDGEAVVSFVAPASDGGSVITLYTVTSSPDGITATGTGSAITVKGLSNGTAYTFKVKAINAIGTGAESAASAPVTPAGKPGLPTGVTAAAGDGEAVVSFGTPASDGGSAITLYTVTSNPDGITATGTGSAITVKGLSNGTAYTFKVKASNAIGMGAESAASAPVTPVGKPGLPTGVTAVAGDGEAVVSFVAPASDGGSAITLYTVTSNPGGITATGTGSAITVKGLSNGTAYTFKVKASNAIGMGAESAASAPVTPAGKPGLPTGVTAAAGDGEAVVSFEAPASDGGSAITLYTVTSNPGGITATGTGSAITVKGLSNGTAYTFKVKASNAIGMGAESAASAPVTPVGKPGLPTGVTAVAGDGEAVVSFAVPASDGGSAIASYTVTSSPGGIIAIGTGSAITVKGLTNGRTYTFKVKATNAIGTGAESAASAPVTPVGKPGAPTGVTAAAGDSEAVISFAAPASDGGSAITSYTVTSNPDGITATGTGSAITVKGLSNGTAYTFKVKATNAVGTGAESAASTPVIPAKVPGVPTGVSAAAGNGCSVVSFTAPASDGGSAIISYTVISSPGGITATGASSPITVKGLSNGTAYTFKVKATNSAGTGAESAASLPVTPVGGSSSGSYSGGSSGGGNGSSSPGTKINNKTENEEDIENTTTNSKGQTVTTITINEQKLSQESGVKIVIPVNSKSEVIAVELTGQLVKDMKTRQVVLEVKTENASYVLPAQEINIDNISAEFGRQVKLQDIRVIIEISKGDNDTIKLMENIAKSGKFTIVASPVKFAIKCTDGNKEISISRFKTFTEKTIAIPSGVDPQNITTGIVIDSDKSIRHVPTQVVRIDGIYYAKIKSLTGDIYSVVCNPVKFGDVDSHWAKDAIDNMGSRMVISGVGNDMFEPDRDITRAEFAAIIVRALGMKPGEGNGSFKDVKGGDWYNNFIKTAYEYKIISGYSEDSFAPADKITREQAMTMIARAMGITGLKVEFKENEAGELLGTFGDSEHCAAWARESMAACVKAGVVSGKDSKTLAPKDEITRAEVAVIVQRLLQKSDLI